MHDSHPDPGLSVEQPSPSARAPALDPFVRRLATGILLVAGAGLLLALFVLGIDILLAAFGGILLAVLLRGLIDLLKRLVSIPDGVAYATVLLLIVLLLGGTGWLLAPQVGEQAAELRERMPQITNEVEGFLRTSEAGRWVLEKVQEGEVADGAAAGVGGILAAASRWSYYGLTFLFVGLFAAANPRLYLEGATRLFPLRHRTLVDEILGRLGHTLRWWLVGQLLAMLLIGVSTAIVLFFFGIPMAAVIGIIVGLLGFIPYLGPIIGLVPVALVSATEGATVLVSVLLAYVGVQLLEGYVATPLIQHRMVYLPPVFTIIAQILLGSLLGILGFILATPLAAVVLVLSRFYRRDLLGEPDVEMSRGS